MKSKQRLTSRVRSWAGQHGGERFGQALLRQRSEITPTLCRPTRRQALATLRNNETQREIRAVIIPGQDR